MRSFSRYILAFACLLGGGLAAGGADQEPNSPPAPNLILPADFLNRLRESLVYLQITSQSYDTMQPWRRGEAQEHPGFGVAVGTNLLITPAANLTNVQYIKARRYGMNEYMTATIKVVDYEANLALLELDPKKLGRPLTPITFSETYVRGATAEYHWAKEDADVSSGQAVLDRAEVVATPISFARLLHYLMANCSHAAGLGELFTLQGEFIGLGCSYRSENRQAWVIPGPVINHFLADAADEKYQGFPLPGCTFNQLVDPATRAFLKLPNDQKNGLYITEVYTLGTGSDQLQPQDVLLAVDGQEINAFGRYQHPRYEWLSVEHLIGSKQVGDTIALDVWRQGQRLTLKVEARTIHAREMMIPWQEYNRQPSYLVTGGFVLQKLTRPYLTHWGSNWQGRVSPYFYRYLEKMAFKPGPERKEVVMLSFVLPHDINLGYHDLRQEVVKTFNGRPVGCLQDILEAQKADPNAPYDIIELEMENPTVVIPRNQLNAANTAIQQSYGVTAISHIEP